MTAIQLLFDARMGGYIAMHMRVQEEIRHWVNKNATQLEALFANRKADGAMGVRALGTTTTPTVHRDRLYIICVYNIRVRWSVRAPV